MSSRWNAVSSRLAKAGMIGIAAAAGFATNPVMAYQDGATVINGDVTFQQNGNHTVITASDGSIINYTNFDILPNEIVQFVQPNELSTVLNRVTSNDPTLIQGQLLANGKVFLVNPAGVVFGQGAVVNVGSLYAAAGNISNQDFLSGNMRFTNLMGNVLNAGSIRANEAYLLGQHVSNRGVISATNGVIAMVAGNDVLIREHGSRITIRVDGNELVGNDMPYAGQTTPDMLADPGVENAGSLYSQGGQVVLGAGDLYGYALLNSGTIRADGGNVSLTAADGLVHNSGLITTSMDTGLAGSITVQGPSLLNTGQLLADSNNGQAGYVEFTSRNHSYMSPGSVISAAGGSGNAHGGEVLVHSYDGQTIMPSGAFVDVSGGATGGRGGFAEVSGLHLLYNGSVGLDAVDGSQAGELLLDPFNVVIDTAENTLPFQDHLLDGDVINFTEGTLTGNTYISSEALEAIIGDITVEALGSIFIFDSLDFGLSEGAFEQNLFLTAGDDVVLGFDTGIFGANNVTIVANAFGNSNGEVQFNSPVEITGFLDVSGALTIINTDSIISGGNQIYRTPVDICLDTHLQGANVHFMGAVDATFSDENMSGMEVTLADDGEVVFDGDVGMATDPNNGDAPRSLAYLIVNGDTVVNAANIRTRDEQTYNGNVTVASPFDRGLFGTTFQSLNGGDIRFMQGIEGQDAVINILTSGVTEISGDVGSQGDLGAIFTDAPGQTELAGNHNASIFDYDDEVMLTDDVTMAASSSATFESTIEGNGNSLDITSNFIHFADNVTGMDTLVTRDYNSRGGAVTLIGAQFDENRGGFGGILIQGNDIDLQTDVSLIDDTFVSGLNRARFGGTVDGGFDLLVESNQLVEFGGDVGGNNPLNSLEVMTPGVIIFDGANSVTSWGDVRLNDGLAIGVPNAATIGATGDLTIESIFGDILFGQNQKLSVIGDFGAFTLNTFQSGDLNALGNINIMAGNINLLGRPTGMVLLSNGQMVMDDGLDIVAGGTIDFSVAPTVSGNGILTVITKDGSGIGGNLGVFDVGTKPDLAAASFTRNGQILDLTGGAASVPVNLAEALDSADFELEDFVPVEPHALRSTDRLAIFMRGMTNEELRSTVSGTHVHMDMQQPGDRGRNPAISTMRLRRDSVLRVIEEYEALHGVSHDEAADVRMIEAAQTEIRNALTDAWEAFVAEAGDGATPEAMMAHLRANVEAGTASEADVEALEYLRGIRQMCRDLQIMGATPHQAEEMINHLVEPLCPAAWTMDQFDLAFEANA